MMSLQGCISSTVKALFVVGVLPWFALNKPFDGRQIGKDSNYLDTKKQGLCEA